MRTVALPNLRLKAIVDDEDYLKVVRHSWYAQVEKGKNTYAVSRIGGKLIRMHRLILGAKKGEIIDHQDHDGLNNRRSNLRLCTNGQNLHNRPPNKNKKSSRFKGVFWYSRKQKYEVFFRCNGKAIRGGFFTNELDAARHYNKLARELLGEFAFLNDVE